MRFFTYVALHDEAGAGIHFSRYFLSNCGPGPSACALVKFGMAVRRFFGSCEKDLVPDLFLFPCPVDQDSTVFV
jgi:hypothetical protein